MTKDQIGRDFYFLCDKSFKFLLTKHKMTLTRRDWCCHEIFTEYSSTELSVYIWHEVLSTQPTVLLEIKRKKGIKSIYLSKIASTYFPDDPINETIKMARRLKKKDDFSIIPIYASFLKKNWSEIMKRLLGGS
jgi:hypothetical protein